MSVSGTKRPPKARSMPQRPWPSASSRPGSTGCGPKATVGRSWRAAVARLTKRATRKGSLAGRPMDEAQLHAARDVDPDGRDVEERRCHVRSVEATGEDDRDVRGDGSGDLDRGAATRAAEGARVARIEQDGLQVRLSGEALGFGHEVFDHPLGHFGAFGIGALGSSALGSSRGVGIAGRDVEDLEDRERDAIEVGGALVAVELDRVEAEPGRDGGHLSRRSVGEDADEQRAVAGAAAARAARDELGRLALVEIAPRARARSSGRWRPRPPRWRRRGRSPR